MGIFNYDDMEVFGKVQGVDTTTVIVQVTDIEQLSKLQVNNLGAIRSSKRGQTLISMVSKIMRKFADLSDFEFDTEENIVTSTAS